MTVLVAIPYYHCEDYIEQAVQSVLAQTNTDLVCLVVGDGDTPPPIETDDKRLVVVSFTDNYGAPFTQQSMLLANPYEKFAPMGADDWLEPDHLASLPTRHRQARISSLWVHDKSGKKTKVRDRAYAEIGVFDTELLRSVGGYDVTQRCGQDTLLYDDILLSVTPAVFSSNPTYHRRMRAGSLTDHPETNFKSEYRKSVIAHNAKVKAKCQAIGWKHTDRIRKYREGLVPVELRVALRQRVEVIQGALNEQRV